jgi:F-box protein 9
MNTPSTPQLIEQEPEELARFRQAWKAELQQRKTSISSSADAFDSSSGHDAESQAGSSTSTIVPVTAAHVVHKHHTPHTHTFIGQERITGEVSHPSVSIYRNAVDHERRGDLDKALALYRQAFRMHNNVDVLYERQEAALRGAGRKPERSHTKQTSTPSIDGLVKDVQKLDLEDTVPTHSIGADALAQMVSEFPQGLLFEAEDQTRPEPIFNKVPDEILLNLVKVMDVSTIERFAMVSRKARVLTLDSVIWA